MGNEKIAVVKISASRLDEHVPQTEPYTSPRSFVILFVCKMTLPADDALDEHLNSLSIAAFQLGFARYSDCCTAWRASCNQSITVKRHVLQPTPRHIVIEVLKRPSSPSRASGCCLVVVFTDDASHCESNPDSRPSISDWGAHHLRSHLR